MNASPRKCCSAESSYLELKSAALRWDQAVLRTPPCLQKLTEGIQFFCELATVQRPRRRGLSPQKLQLQIMGKLLPAPGTYRY